MPVLKEINRRLRFTYDDDIILLREVVAQNPWTCPERWEIVQINVQRTVGKEFQITTLKQHVQLLLELWAKKDRTTTMWSGEEEPYSERDVLLQEVNNIYINASTECAIKKRKVSRDKQLSDLGKEAREKVAVVHFQSSLVKGDLLLFDDQHLEEVAIESSCANENAAAQEHSYNMPSTSMEQPIPETPKATLQKTPILRPVGKRRAKTGTLRQDALSYLNNKSDREMVIQEKQLALEERRLAFEEKKLYLEERKQVLKEKKQEQDLIERRERFTMDREHFQLGIAERKTLHNLIESQQKLIELLFQIHKSL